MSESIRNSLAQDNILHIMQFCNNHEAGLTGKNNVRSD